MSDCIPPPWNYLLMAITALSTLFAIASEMMGYVNKWKEGRCTSVVEFVLKSLHLIKEPSPEEILADIREQRRRAEGRASSEDESAMAV